ncbi:MAG: hypothetical protein KF716_09565 [Anaerolineae bacterium]|nr:hypothetical protein [Anaerolineae bacterium]
MPTATLTPTPIPKPLATLPEKISDDDLAIANGNLVVQITRIRVLENKEKMSATGANRLLGLNVILYNYSDSTQTFNDNDFNFRYGDSQSTPSVDLMDVACTTLLEKSSPCAPRRNVFWDKDFNISPKDWVETILVFEVPNIPDRAVLEFSPVNLPKKNIGIWLIDLGQGEYFGVKESADGQNLYTTEVKVTNESFDTLIDSYVVDIKNCFASTILEEERNVSKTETSSLMTGATLEWKGVPIEFSMLSGIPFLKSVVDNTVRAFLVTRKSERNEGESITYSTVHRMRANPHSWTRYQINIYLVSIQGIVTIRVGNRLIEVPFQITQRIRSEAVSIPDGVCSSLTPSATP